MGYARDFLQNSLTHNEWKCIYVFRVLKTLPLRPLHFPEEFVFMLYMGCLFASFGFLRGLFVLSGCKMSACLTFPIIHDK